MADDREQRLEQLCARHGVTELFGICANELVDVERIRTAFAQWMRHHPELIDDNL